MGLAEDWVPVVTSISKLDKKYRLINRIISLGLDIKVRRKGVTFSGAPIGRVLDAGAGDGSLSIELLRISDSKLNLILLDPLVNMLKIARQSTNDFRTHYVLGLLENPPFRNNSFDKVYMAFSLRDMFNLDVALRNLSIMMKKNATFTIIDIGKPDYKPLQFVFSIYWMIIAPLLTLVAAPLAWRLIHMIYPTYKRLFNNSKLINELKKYFKVQAFKSMYYGGIIIILTEKTA